MKRAINALGEVGCNANAFWDTLRPMKDCDRALCKNVEENFEEKGFVKQVFNEGDNRKSAEFIM